MPLKIRALELDDIGEVSQLVRGLSYYYVKGHEYAVPDWFLNTLTYDAFTERYYDQDFASFVYEKSGNIHGYLAIRQPNEVYHLFVAEAVHGRGVGSQLWQHAKEALNLQNESVITLKSSLTAVPFYQKLGFVIAGEIEEKQGICYQPMQLHTTEEVSAH